MTARTMVNISERWLDQVVLAPSAVPTDVGADVIDTYALPAGFGDCAIMEIQILATSTATILADAVLANTGIYALITNAGGTSVDFAGTAKWVRAGATRVATWLSPDPLVLWRQDELLLLAYPELDTNGAPTDDHTVRVKVVRVRPMATPSEAIQLVR